MPGVPLPSPRALSIGECVELQAQLPNELGALVDGDPVPVKSVGVSFRFLLPLPKNPHWETHAVSTSQASCVKSTRPLLQSQTALDPCGRTGFPCRQDRFEGEHRNFLRGKAPRIVPFQKSLRARFRRSEATKGALLARRFFRSTSRGTLLRRFSRCAASRIPCEQGFVVWGLPKSLAGKHCHGARFEQALPARKSPNDEPQARLRQRVALENQASYEARPRT